MWAALNVIIKLVPNISVRNHETPNI
jgi:hypothetical protein